MYVSAKTPLDHNITLTFSVDAKMFLVSSDHLIQNKLVAIVVLVVTCCCLCEGRTLPTADIGIVIQREAVSSRLFLKWDYTWKFCQIYNFDNGKTSNSYCEFSCEAREYPPYFCPKGTFAIDIWYETKRTDLRSWKLQTISPTFTPWLGPLHANYDRLETMGIEFMCVTSSYCVSEPSAKIGPPPPGNYLSAIVSEKKQICAKDVNGAVLVVTQSWTDSSLCIMFLSMYPMNNPNCEFCESMNFTNDEGWILDDDLKETMKRLWRPCFESDEEWVYMLMYYCRRFGSCIFRDPTEYYRMATRLFINQNKLLEKDLCRQYIVHGSHCLIPYEIWSDQDQPSRGWKPLDMRRDLNSRRYSGSPSDPGWYSNRENERVKLYNHIVSDFLQVVT
jgi:hypothetical protein